MSKQTANLGLNKPDISDTPGVTIPQLAANFDLIDASLADMALDVKNFGAKGDGVTDDTSAFQAAINALGVYTYTHPDPSNKITNGGGTILVPKPPVFYKITGSLLYRSSIHFVGDGFTSIIKHMPTVPRHLFQADTSNYAALGSHHQVTFEKINLVGDRLTSGTGLSDSGLDILNTRYANVIDCVIAGFNTGIKMYRDNTTSYGYFNTIQRTYCYNNVLNADVETNGTQVIGGELSNNNNWTYSDYMLKITAAGCAVIGTTIEGSPNIAQVSDAGLGTSFIGEYTETTQGDIIGQKPFIEENIAVGGTSVSIQGLYSATLSNVIKFKNLFNSTDGTQAYDINYGITLNGNGDPVDVLVNPFFRNFLQGWNCQLSGTSNYARLTSTNQYLLGSDYGLKLIKTTDNDNGNGNRIYQTVTTPVKQMYATCLVQLSSDAVFDFYAWDFGESGAQYGARTVDYGNGWYLYVIALSQLNTQNHGTIAARLETTSPTGSWAVITNIQLYTGGFPVFPSFHKNARLEANSKPSYFLDGYFYQGDFIRNTQPTEQGTAGSKYVTIGWDVLTEGWGGQSGQTPIGSIVERRTLSGN